MKPRPKFIQIWTSPITQFISEFVHPWHNISWFAYAFTLSIHTMFGMYAMSLPFFLKRNLIRWSIQRHGYLIGADALWLYKSVLSDLINWRWTFELSYKRHRTNSIRLHNSKHSRDEYRVSKIRNQNLPYRHCVMSFMRKEKKFIRACQIINRQSNIIGFSIFG